MIQIQPTIQPNPKQHLAWQALESKDIINIHYGGGAGGGKSWLGCESRLVRAYRYPGYRSYIGRNELTRLMASTYVTWTKVCAFHKIPQSDWRLNGKYNYIEFKNPETDSFDGMGSRIDLLDLSFKPSDPMYERFGSFEFSDGGWTDEAGEVPFMAIDILKSRGGRHLNDKYGIKVDSLYTYNPNKGWVYKIHKMDKEGTLPKDTVFIRALFNDNPWTAKIYGEQLDRLTDPAMKARLKLGSFEYDNDPATLIDYDASLDMFTNTVDTTGEKAEKYMTIDVARHGVDRTVIYLWKGWKLYGVRIYAKQDTAVTSQKAREIARDESIAYSRSLADEDGIGGAVVDNNKGFKGFIANSSALTNPITFLPENYANLKAQCTYGLADKINKHEIAIDIEPDQFKSEVPAITYEVWREQLIEELEQIKSKDIDKDSKLKIISKDEIKEALGRSPDFSDTLMMRKWFDYKPSLLTQAHIHYPSSAVPMMNNTSNPHLPNQRTTAYTHVPRL